MKHELKTHPEPFDELASGLKTCEVRYCSDRVFKAGDEVHLTEVNELGNPTGKEALRHITHVQHGWGLPEHLCVLSYAPVELQGDYAELQAEAWGHEGAAKAMQAELTQALELLRLASIHVPVNYPSRKTIETFLSNYSAPAQPPTSKWTE